MNLVTLTETIIKKIVTDPESVSVKEFETEEENTIQIEVLISSDDMGKVIGKNGKIINSIRTIVQASSSLEDNKKVKINVDSY
ncbi:MAG: KH domain-containing protein [Bacilli bacterium]|nr:KH domain-containing protein [Bacilli bacterium]